MLCTEMQGFPALMTLPPEDDTLAFINGALWNKLFRSDIALAHRIPDFKSRRDLCYQTGDLPGLQQHCLQRIRVLIHWSCQNRIGDFQYGGADHSVLCGGISPAVSSGAGSGAKIPLGCWPLSTSAFRWRCAADNPQINLHAHLKWTARYLKDHYGWLRRKPVDAPAAA